MGMIETINGLQDEANLVKTEGTVDNDNEFTTWVEYRDAGGVLVHRSVHVTIKEGLAIDSVGGSIGG